MHGIDNQNFSQEKTFTVRILSHTLRDSVHVKNCVPLFFLIHELIDFKAPHTVSYIYLEGENIFLN